MLASGGAGVVPLGGPLTTATGVERKFPVPELPSPSWPNGSFPQQAAVPLLRTAHVCKNAASIITPLMLPPPPVTTCGVLLPEVVPVPSWPAPLFPQQRAVPSA